MELLFAISLIGLIAWAIYERTAMAGKTKALDLAFSSIRDFTQTARWTCGTLDQAMAIDASRGKLALVRLYGDAHHTTVLAATQVMSAEIIEDGTHIQKTARMGQIGGAALGGLVLGPAGAIIGGLSGQKKQINKASLIELNILTENIREPLFQATFLNVETDKSGAIYRTAIQDARLWQGRIKALIHSAANGTAPTS